MSELPFLLPVTPHSSSLLRNESQPLSLTFPIECLTKSCSSIALKENFEPLAHISSTPSSFLHCYSSHVPLDCPLFGLGLHLAPSLWVRSLASSAFLSQCFFPGPWHLPCAAPLSLMSSLHIHCLSLLISWRVLVQRTAQKIFVLICFLCSPHSQPHFLPSKPCFARKHPRSW